jgi:hypothetical protein
MVSSLLLVPAGLAHARCGDDPGDAAAVDAARGQVATDCDCTGAPNHGTYVACAAGVARERIHAHTLPPRCRSAVQRCAARSTCGKPGTVACCLPAPSDRKCKITDSGACTANGGCASTAPSCCEACGGACGPTTTTTTTLPTNPCAGQCSCPPGDECADVRIGCACVPAPACGPIGGNSCGGNCPAGTGEPCHYNTSNGHCTCGCIGSGQACPDPGRAECCPPSFTCGADGFCP